MGLLDLSFLRPALLLALLPLGLLVWQLWRTSDAGAVMWQRLVDPHLLAHLLVVSNPRRQRSGVVLFAAGLLLAVLALAGPTRGPVPQATVQRDVLRLLVLELSPAMTAPLVQVRLKLLALLQAWPEGQTALLVYGGEPYLVVPPTSDVETIALFVPELAPEALPVPGNQPDRAWRLAHEVLARSTAQQREVVWVTAGSSGVTLPLAELAGVRLSILQTAGPPEPALAAAASRTGGALVQLRADDADVRQLLGALAAPTAWTAGAGNGASAPADLGYWLLLPLLPLAALAFRRGILLGWLALWLAGSLAPQPALAQGWSVAAVWADEQAWRLLQAGQPDAAAARFADPRWRAVAQYRAGQYEQAAATLASSTEADAHYNRGNALAQQGKLAEALAAYDAALALRADDADTRYNRELVQRLLKQPPPPPPPPNGGKGGAAPPAGADPSATGQGPPPPQPAPGQDSEAEREAQRVADQWLRRIPDQPGSLLRRKLLAEQRRRQSGEAGRSW
jgi:Ca-activated chloride channel family protein